ncbi:MAG TPA: cysteine peptidase family C39 domain-containing protein [Alphaproteobacteria bacterium]|nr:cysteine peptidase family C39 domain-containing protein [Alphaproteobacteria bacterium]
MKSKSDKKILDVPLIRQEKDSKDCGLAGVSMIFGYYKIKKGLEDLKKEVKVYDSGTYAPQLGEYLIRRGFDVEIVTMHPRLFTLKNLGASEKDIEKIIEEKYKVQNISEKDKLTLDYFKSFLKIGGRINVKIPSIKDIEEEIDNKRPLGALMTTNFIKGEKPIFNFHFNIITGYDKENIYVNDPLDDARGGKHAYDKDAFIYGLYASAYSDMDNASLIKIKYNPRKGTGKILKK